MVTCEAGVVVCHGVLSSGSAKRSFPNRFRWLMWALFGWKGSGRRVLSLSGAGRCGTALGLLLLMVGVHELTVKLCCSNLNSIVIVALDSNLLRQIAYLYFLRLYLSTKISLLITFHIAILTS